MAQQEQDVVRYHSLLNKVKSNAGNSDTQGGVYFNISADGHGTTGSQG